MKKIYWYQNHFFNENSNLKETKYPFIFKPDITPGGKLGVQLITQKKMLMTT